MGVIQNLFARLKGRIDARGTFTTPSGDETFPVAISNEIMGGPFIYTTAAEMKTIPAERLIAGCKCTLTDYQGLGKRITYVLRNVPADSLANLGAEIEEYWEIDGVALDATTTIEQEFSASVEGSKPPFLGLDISKDAYNAGYKSDEDYDTGDTELKVWSGTYDPLLHKWVRQRISATADWGAPVKINESYESGQYNDIRFQWKLIGEGAPARPLSLVSGVLNNSPVWWNDTPDIPDGQNYNTWIQSNALWRISAIKTVYGDLDGEWTTPVKISTDPNLVRYGIDPNNYDYLNDTHWRAYYTKGDLYRASRLTTGDPWIVERISGESGEYTSYVFKEFDDSYVPTIDDAPKTVLGYGNNLWQDGVFNAADGKTLHVSTARKYSDGTFVGGIGWTIPVRYDGKNTIRGVVSPSGSTTFKYQNTTGIKVVTPLSIALVAKLFEANKEVPSTSFTSVSWYYGHPDTGTQIPIQPVGAAPNRKAQISGANNQNLQIFPENVSGTQVIGLKIVYGGEDYKDVITLADATDADGFQVAIEASTGWIYKGTETKTFTARFYSNGVDVTSSLGVRAWKLDGNPIGAGLTVTIPDTSVTSLKQLSLEITYNGVTYKRTETLTDVSDGTGYDRKFSTLEVISGDPIAAPGEWSDDSANAIWAVEKLTSASVWNTPYKVKGEKGIPSGAFQKTVYRTAAPPATSPPSWTATAPDKRTGAGNPLIPIGWSENPESNPATDSTIWGSKATFYKNPANEDLDEIVDNWSISADEWSAPFKITHFQPAGSSGTPGTNGFNGWSPVLRPTSDGQRQVLKLHEWVGGTGSKPAGEGYYLSSDFGLVSDISLATDIKGAPGNDGNDGVFNVSDFWAAEGVLQISGRNTTPNNEAWDFRFRKSKSGIVTYTGRCYRYGNGNRTFDINITAAVNAFGIIPFSTGLSIGTNFRGAVILNGHNITGYDNNPSQGYSERRPMIIKNSNGTYTLRLNLTKDFCFVANGSYPTADTYN